jgi:transcription-repair coupling factor (superfamily II helicase)
VYEHGEFAVRGSLMDMFPMGSDLPLRIDLLDDEIDSLRCFDPETQRTLRPASTASNCCRRGSFPSTGGASGASSSAGTPASTSTTTSVPCSRKSAPAAHPAVRRVLPAPVLRPLRDCCSTTFPHSGAGHRRRSPRRRERFFAEAQRRYEDFNIDPRRPAADAGEVFTPVEDAVPRT